MATSTKTLTPTNQTITIPDMTERPNVSLLTDGIGKEADAINALNSNFGSLQTYTPTIASSSTGFAADNISFSYVRVGKLLFINGRFNISNVGSSPTVNGFTISLPSGMSCTDKVGAAGFIAVNKNGVDTSKLSFRQGTNNLWCQVGAGGDGALNILGTVYIVMNATVIIN